MFNFFKKHATENVGKIRKYIRGFAKLRSGYDVWLLNPNGHRYHDDNETLRKPNLEARSLWGGLKTVAHLNERIEGKFRDVGEKVDVKIFRGNDEVHGRTNFSEVSAAYD
jgi:hypothetical protein